MATMAKRAQFFYKYAGFSWNPKTETEKEGRARCAMALAEAEAEAEEREWTFRWEWDEDPDLSWMDDEERAKDHEVLGCVLVTSVDRHAESLWGIVDPSSEYRRVVEAELADQHLAAIRDSVFEAV